MSSRLVVALLCAAVPAVVWVSPVEADQPVGVSVVVDSRGDLVIIGDGGNNRVTVRAVEDEAEPDTAVPGAFTVDVAATASSDGALHRRATYNVVGATGRLRVALQGGDDRLAVEGLPGFWNIYDEYESGDPAAFVGTMTVAMGGGDDELSLSGVGAARLTVNLGSGNDDFWALDVNVARYVNGVYRPGDAVVRGGSGDDTVGLQYLWGVDRLDVDLGPGKGDLNLFTSGAARTVIATESSDDVITVADSALGLSPLITTGPGDDHVNLCRNGVPGFTCSSGSQRWLSFPSWSGKLQILTGAGDDQVIVSGQTGATIPVKLDIATSVGNDLVQLAMEAQQFGRLDGGGGTADTLVVDDLVGHPTPKRFETITEGRP